MDSFANNINKSMHPYFEQSRGTIETRQILSEIDSGNIANNQQPASTLAALQQAKRLFRSRKSGSENSKSSKSSGDRLCSPAVVRHMITQPSHANRRILMNKLKVNDGPGFLNIDINPLGSAIILNIVEAKNLQCPTDDLCNTFVKVRLIPEDLNIVDCSTKIVYRTNNPTFNEKISFQILQSDYNKRLLIGAFHQDIRECCIHLLGSMSFGIGSLMSKSRDQLKGWYHLLPEEFGHHKHKKIKMKDKEIHSVNQDIDGMDSIKVRAIRGTSGFGFSIGGGCPCKITKVLNVNTCGETQPMVGDYLVSVNSKNVSRATLESVVRMIRKCKIDVTLELYRPKMIINRKTAARYAAGIGSLEGSPINMHEASPYTTSNRCDNRCEQYSSINSLSNSSVDLQLANKRQPIKQRNNFIRDKPQISGTGFRRTTSAASNYFSAVSNQWITSNGQKYRPSEYRTKYHMIDDFGMEEQHEMAYLDTKTNVESEDIPYNDCI
ncbi:hypothetical protein GJ496_000774 [Pomphorhynchus laevis]|nr:hypothetical protein GJ496_000774 [Pomphorhynchus laevis]